MFELKKKYANLIYAKDAKGKALKEVAKHLEGDENNA